MNGMKKNGFKILTVACVVGANLTFSSCVDNLLNQTPAGELSSSLYWKTESDAEYAINGVYSQARAMFNRDYVFDGKLNRPYSEYDVPFGPLSVYGQSKLLGEQNIQNSCDNWVIVRVSWLYGEGGKNFVSTMLKAARSGLPEIKVVNDQIGNPTSTVSAAAAIERLLETDFRGIVHATCEGEASWFDFAQEIFRAAGINQKVVPCTTEEYPRPAPRPRNSRLENQVLRELQLPPMLDWRKELSLRIGALI